MTEQPAIVEDIEPTEANRLVVGGAHLLDVREDEEWQAGRAPAAAHLPMGQVVDRQGEIPTDRIVVCICRAGGRSASVAGLLAAHGYEVRNVAGGMQAWESAGLPVVSDGGAPGQVV